VVNLYVPGAVVAKRGTDPELDKVIVESVFAATSSAHALKSELAGSTKLYTTSPVFTGEIAGVTWLIGRVIVDE
jgi:hypothetical protein